MRSSLLRTLTFIVTLLLFSSPVFANDNILGVWKIIDDKSGNPTALVAMYSHNAIIYGKIIATLDKDTGRITDTILTRVKKATAIVGDPPLCGLDIVFDLKASGKNYKGSIIDPENGKEYACTIWRDGDKLIVRGSLKGTGGLLGRNQTWENAVGNDILKGFVFPDFSLFRPVAIKGK